MEKSQPSDSNRARHDIAVDCFVVIPDLSRIAKVIAVQDNAVITVVRLKGEIRSDGGCSEHYEIPPKDYIHPVPDNWEELVQQLQEKGTDVQDIPGMASVLQDIEQSDYVGEAIICSDADGNLTWKPLIGTMVPEQKGKH